MRDVLEEILADAYAGINVFDFLDSEEGAKRLSDDVQNVVSKVAGDGVSRGPTSEGTKYSSKAEVLSLKNVDWMADDSSIKQQLQKHTDILNTMDPVAVVDFKSIPTGKLVEKIMYEVSRIGGSFMKRQGITFQFDEEGAKRINAHAKDAELQAAALAAPYVAKYGVLIAGQKNHEGTGLTTLTFAAPAIINEQPVNVGVVIQFQADGSPRAVNVGLQSGKPFKIKKEASKGLDSRVERYVQGTSLPTKDASAFKIAQKTEESNNYYSSRAKTLQKAGNMLAADRGDTSAAQFADRPPDALRHGLRDVYRRGTTDTSRRRPPPTHRVGGGRSRFRIVRPLTPRARA